MKTRAKSLLKRLGKRSGGANGVAGAAVALALTWGCTGYIGGTNGNGKGTGPGGQPGGSGPGQGDKVRPTSADAPTSFSCDPKQKPAMDQLRALTNRQYFNTLGDLLTMTLGASSAAAVLKDPKVVAAVGLLPANGPNVPQPLPKPNPPYPGTLPAIDNATALATAFPDGGWLRADQSIQQDRVAAFYEIAAALGDVLANGYLGAMAGSCALGSGGATNTACLDTFIRSFGARALRRAVTDADVSFYEGNYKLNGPDDTLTNPAASGYQDVLTGLFAAPEFLYFVEHGDPGATQQADGVYPLSAYELASRLSYQVWDTLPDAELWGHAVDGTLTDDKVYESEVARLFGDPRAQSTLDLFFADYFQTNPKGGLLGTGGLNYHDLAALSNAPSPAAKAFVGADMPGASLYGDMVADAVGYADYYTWTTEGTLHDLLTGDLSFAQTKDVADIYGLAPWDGKGTPPSFPAGQRPGVFTRALFVSAGIETTPILKGVFFRRYVLCDELGPPPPAAAGKVVKIVGFETTEQATEALTSSGICASCHPLFINPLGFATESFDGLGRFRTHETLYKDDGSVAASLPVDTSVIPRVWMGDYTTKVADAKGLMDLAESSGKPGACLTRNYFRYAFARFEDVKVDGCSLEPMKKTLDDGGHLADLWKSVVFTPAFKNRTFL